MFLTGVGCFRGVDFADGVFELFARQNHVPSAAFADDADVAADAENRKAGGAARMLFLQLQHVADQDFRNVHEFLPFKIITFYYNTENRICKPFPIDALKISQKQGTSKGALKGYYITGERIRVISLLRVAQKSFNIL